MTIPEKQPKISALVSLVKVKSQDFMENFDPNKKHGITYSLWFNIFDYKHVCFILH